MSGTPVGSGCVVVGSLGKHIFSGMTVLFVSSHVLGLLNGTSRQVVSLPSRFSCNRSICSHSRLSWGTWERAQLIVTGGEMKDVSVLEIAGIWTGALEKRLERSSSARALWGPAETLENPSHRALVLPYTRDWSWPCSKGTAFP